MTPESARSLSLTTESLIAAAAVIPEGQPFFMLNLLRYKERAEYRDRPEAPVASGREAYHAGYVGTFVVIAQELEVDVSLAWRGSVITGLVAPLGEQWHELAIVSYPSFAVFRRIVESPRYLRDCAPHRLASLEDWRLLATAKLA
jgi:hypothetical protein